MKNLLQFLIIFSMIIVSSCTTVSHRSPAQVDNIFLEAAFSIPQGNIKTEKSYEKLVRDYMQSQMTRVQGLNLKIELMESQILSKDIAYKIGLDIDQVTSEMVYKIQHAPGVFNDPVASFTLMDFMRHLVVPDTLQSPFSTFELYYNAKAGDPIALDSFLKLRSFPTYQFKDNDHNVFETPDFFKGRQHITDMRAKLVLEIKALKANRKQEKLKRKKGLETLDKAPEEQQFRTLVSKGDRDGAAKILRQYLPWEEMAPFEKQFWETQLEVMVNPVPLEERILIYRGLDGDYVHRAFDSAKTLTEKEAIEQNKAFFMSTLVVKNQGSWNRRLRSLEAMNDKFIALAANESNEYSSVARISTMFGKHSASPNGSPFLSFTPDYSIAENFGEARVSSYLMDPRLLNFNYTSLFEEEIEYLVPLTTFPDELVGIAENMSEVEGKSYALQSDILNEKLEKLILKKYGSKRQEEVLSKIKKNSFDFFKYKYHDIHDPALKSVGESNKTFYKKFLTKHDPKIALASNGELQCKDLISLFWMAK